MRISDWSSDVCSSDLTLRTGAATMLPPAAMSPIGAPFREYMRVSPPPMKGFAGKCRRVLLRWRRNPMAHLMNRSEEHTSDLQSLMRFSYAVFCLKKKYQQFLTTYIILHTYAHISFPFTTNYLTLTVEHT